MQQGEGKEKSPGELSTQSATQEYPWACRPPIVMIEVSCKRLYIIESGAGPVKVKCWVESWWSFPVLQSPWRVNWSVSGRGLALNVSKDGVHQLGLRSERRAFLRPAPGSLGLSLRRSQAASSAAQGSAQLGRRRGFLLPAPTRSASRLRRWIFARSCAMVAAKAPLSASLMPRAAVDPRSFLRKGRIKLPCSRHNLLSLAPENDQ